jgi:CubicO group peptidase (beta-lactamase class C family)
MQNDNQFYHPNKEEDFHQSLLQLMKEYHIPGAALALIENEKITTFELGVKDIRFQQPVTSSTIFEGASLSKPLIAYAALKLCENGHLDIDRPLSIYLNDFNPIENPRLSAITLRHVLSHTSGFPAANLKKGELLKLEFEPGSQFTYSGESFRYLGRVLEHITGVPLSTYMRENVFRPLKMDNSSFIWEERYAVDVATPHDRKGVPTEKWKPAQAVASFSLHTTALDFAKFMVEVKRFPKMLEVNSRINETLSWGLGWGIEALANGTTAFWHTGDNGTFQCFAFQENARGLVIMTNSANGFNLCRKLLNLVFEGDHPLIDWEKFDSRNEEPIDEEFLSNWWKHYDLKGVIGLPINEI